MWHLRVTAVAGKCNNITYSLYVSVVLVAQQVMHICRTVLSSVACLFLTYFSPSSHKGHDYRKKVTGHKQMCFNFLYNLCLKYSSFKTKWSEM